MAIITESYRRRQTEDETMPLDWRDLLRRYMKAVLSYDDEAAYFITDPESFEGTDDERAAVWALFVEVHREYLPNHPTPTTREQGRSLGWHKDDEMQKREED